MKLSRRSIERLLELAEMACMEVASESDARLLARARDALLPTRSRITNGRSRRRKGQSGERDAICYLKDQGFGGELKRGLQSRGGGKEQADVLGTGILHLEVKRQQTINIHSALQQACDDCSEGKIPIVLHRRNNEGWKVTLRGDDFFRIFRESEFMEEKEPVCENNLPDCGPAVAMTVDDVRLCLRCAAEMEKDPSCHSPECPCFLCSGKELLDNPDMTLSVKVVDRHGSQAPLFGEDQND